MAEGTLTIKRVTQDQSDPTGQSFILHFNRNLTHAECETVATHLSLQFLPTEVNGPDTAVVRRARAEFFFDPELRKKVKALMALAEAQAVKNLALEHRLEGEAAARDEETRRQLEAIDWDEDDEAGS